MFELKFELAFIKKRGNEFQDFFSDIMEIRFPGDFQRSRPWGRLGDRKNDGYRRSERRLFGVYAPNAMSERECVEKVDSDFRGAVPYWEHHFDKWTFVHNARDGLGPSVQRHLLELEAEFPHIGFGYWGFEELHNEAFQLSLPDLIRLLGAVLTSRDMLEVRADELRAVIDFVSLGTPEADIDLRPVPMGKVQHNRLSDAVDTLINAGRSRAPLVEKVLGSLQPNIAERIAASMRNEYREAKSENLAPDEIFFRLQRFVGGSMLETPARQAATMAFLTHFFDLCEIFERPTPDVIA